MQPIQDNNTKKIVISIYQLKYKAKILSKEKDIKRSAALNILASEHGFSSWNTLMESRKDHSRTIFSENQNFLSTKGIEYAYFIPTETGLEKSILDATQSVRDLFKLEKFHDYALQGQGEDFKVSKEAFLVTEKEIITTKVSLYRPITKHGDPRMWFSNLKLLAEPEDYVAIIVFNHSLYLINLSDKNLVNLDESSAILKFLSKYQKEKGAVASELLSKLKTINQSPIKSVKKGDTGVGMSIEASLGIAANSSKEPDYKGIELKSGRGKNKTRTTLFAQVANWSLSACKSSAEILEKYGYDRGDDKKLYCTISTQKRNSQGLIFVYDSNKDLLIEIHGKDEIVAIWEGDVLRNRLLEKHNETFWIDVDSDNGEKDGTEYFHITKVTHTKKPLVAQLLTLIQQGIITMDHLIKKKDGRVSEKGPLFKIDKKNLPLLFPKPETYIFD